MNVIVVDPAATPVTRPVLLTVATAPFEEAQGVVPSGVPDPVNCKVAPAHSGPLPEIVGEGFTPSVTVV
jgi:hypothetical protein